MANKIIKLIFKFLREANPLKRSAFFILNLFYLFFYNQKERGKISMYRQCESEVILKHYNAYGPD